MKKQKLVKLEAKFKGTDIFKLDESSFIELKDLEAVSKLKGNEDTLIRTQYKDQVIYCKNGVKLTIIK